MSETTQTKETVGSFTMKVLNGSATAIIVSLIPSAILSTFLTPFVGSNAIVANLLHNVTVFQYFFAVMCGFSIAKQFNLGYTEAACVGGAAFLGSGCVTAVTTTVKGRNYHQLPISWDGGRYQHHADGSRCCSLHQVGRQPFRLTGYRLLPNPGRDWRRFPGQLDQALRIPGNHGYR